MSIYTKEYITLKAAEAAFEAADDSDLVSLRAFEAAEKVWFAALMAAKAEWAALDINELDRMDAELNASETEGCLRDELRWYQIAIATAEMSK